MNIQQVRVLHSHVHSFALGTRPLIRTCYFRNRYGMIGGMATRSTGMESSSETTKTSTSSTDNVISSGRDDMNDVDPLHEMHASEVPEVAKLRQEDPQKSVGVVAKGKSLIEANPVAGYSLLVTAGFLSITFAIAVIKSAAKGFTKQGKRTRTVQKNKLVIDELNKYLPENREQLQGSSITGIRLRTGFSQIEIFRKYLWYLLRERKFDHDALADLVELKSCLGLSDGDVAEALKERASRIFEKYGTIMLDTSGMSPAGIERKATSRALFSKLLYLVECDDVLNGESRQNVDLRDIFGATEDDVGRLRIASLYEVDLDTLLRENTTDPSPEGNGDLQQ